MFGEETKTGKHNRVKTIRKKGGENGGGGMLVFVFWFWNIYLQDLVQKS